MSNTNTTIDFKKLIIFEDSGFIVINKPAFISTLQDRNSPLNIQELSRTYCKNARVCHRLDKETTGILVLAKDEIHYRHFSKLLSSRRVEKVYHAVIQGSPPVAEKRINKPLFLASSGKIRVDYRNGKESITHLRVLQKFKGYSLVEFKPVTGRMHQIRVHSSSEGHPIIGDTQYQGEYFYLSQVKRSYKVSGYEEKPLFQRVALHAYSVSFVDTDDKMMSITAEYPKDFHVLLKQLNKYASI